MIDGQPPQPNHMEEEEKGWWEATSGDEPEPEIKPETTQDTEVAATTIGLGEGVTKTPSWPSVAVLLFGLFSPWNWYGSGFQALRWSFEDVQFVLTDGLSFYSEWGMTPLDYIQWLMYPLLPLVFVTTFVATWRNKSRQGDEEFGRKASIFHLCFFGVWYLLNILNSGLLTGQFELVFPTERNYGMWIAAASGIGLHPTVYGLGEHITAWFDNR
jgi:hypothetical protein